MFCMLNELTRASLSFTKQRIAKNKYIVKNLHTYYYHKRWRFLLCTYVCINKQIGSQKILLISTKNFNSQTEPKIRF